jgi:hypothetical protein
MDLLDVAAPCFMMSEGLPAVLTLVALPVMTNCVRQQCTVRLGHVTTFFALELQPTMLRRFVTFQVVLILKRGGAGRALKLLGSVRLHVHFQR